MKKETSFGLKLFKEFLQSKPKERYSRYSGCRGAAVHTRFVIYMYIVYIKRSITLGLNVAKANEKLIFSPLEHKFISARC